MSSLESRSERGIHQAASSSTLGRRKLAEPAWPPSGRLMVTPNLGGNGLQSLNVAAPLSQPLCRNESERERDSEDRARKEAEAQAFAQSRSHWQSSMPTGMPQ